MLLFGNMRIAFTNMTENNLTELNIFGCESEFITKLEPNESQTVWVGITGDCFINLSYKKDYQEKSEIITGCMIGGAGKRMDHKISIENQVVF